MNAKAAFGSTAMGDGDSEWEAKSNAMTKQLGSGAHNNVSPLLRSSLSRIFKGLSTSIIDPRLCKHYCQR